MSGKAKEATPAPPPEWFDPGGTGEHDTTADALSWEAALRGGLADKLTTLVNQQRPVVEAAQRKARLGRSRGHFGVTAEAERQISIVEPLLAHNSALLAAAAPWCGRGTKALQIRLQETTAALAIVEAAAVEFETARRIILATAPPAARADLDKALLATVDQAMASRVAGPRKAAEAARRACDENAAAIADLERRLTALRRRTAAV